MEIEVLRADREYRSKLILFYLLGILGGIILWKWVLPPFVAFLWQLPNKERIEAREFLSHLLLVLFIPSAIYCIVVGRRICRHKAIPYPGMRVIRDTIIIRGKRAVARGRALIVLGIVLIAMVIGSIITTHFLTLQFKNHPMFKQIFYGADTKRAVI